MSNNKIEKSSETINNFENEIKKLRDKLIEYFNQVESGNIECTEEIENVIKQLENCLESGIKISLLIVYIVIEF